MLVWNLLRRERLDPTGQRFTLRNASVFLHALIEDILSVRSNKCNAQGNIERVASMLAHYAVFLIFSPIPTTVPMPINAISLNIPRWFVSRHLFLFIKNRCARAHGVPTAAQKSRKMAPRKRIQEQTEQIVLLSW